MKNLPTTTSNRLNIYQPQLQTYQTSAKHNFKQMKHLPAPGVLDK